ncbi:GFA family protein [Maricaulis sp.]|uniref:GFA family protein n=1 Tax=Maricaulis sp. TaxID=1486257 RepID=UPI001B072D37|nr:GFA family protein [Maricaulis sp.]MBO6765387.1 GFA family protein [Maricaulis sp.]
MSEDHETHTGSCRCGQTRMEVTAPALITMACHCDGCRKMTSSAFSLSAMVPAEAFSVVGEEPVKGGLRGPQLDHYFCPHCMSWMFTRIVGMDALVNVRASLFDTRDWATPFIETMTSEKLDWATTPAVHSYPAFPPMGDFQSLMTEYAGR